LFQKRGCDSIAFGCTKWPPGHCDGIVENIRDLTRAGNVLDNGNIYLDQYFEKDAINDLLVKCTRSAQKKIDLLYYIMLLSGRKKFSKERAEMHKKQILLGR